MQSSTDDANEYKIKLKKNILLLQGPIGKFFNHFKRFCYKYGGVDGVYKINFQIGELLLYFDKNTYFYRGTIDAWGQYLKEIVEKHKIEQIFLLSTSRIYHQIAIDLAKELNIDVYVFEQGYIRPHYVTIEQNGVNAETNLPKCPEFYLNLNTDNKVKPDKPIINEKRKQLMSIPYNWALFIVHLSIYGYGIVATNYLINKHHISPFKDRGKWIFLHTLGFSKLFLKSLFAKVNFKTKKNNNYWIKKNKANYYFYPLQVASDTQLTQNAKMTIEESLIQVIESFQAFSLPETYLIIKHHPLDRGHNNYKKLIFSLAKKYNIPHRIKYIYDCNLSKALQYSLGVIVINSTTGLSALLHKKPVICLSKTAVYDISSLTYQKDLHTFWQEAKSFTINEKLLHNFYVYLKRTTQFQGEFYAPSFTRWSQKFVSQSRGITHSRQVSNNNIL